MVGGSSARMFQSLGQAYSRTYLIHSNPIRSFLSLIETSSCFASTSSIYSDLLRLCATLPCLAILRLTKTYTDTFKTMSFTITVRRGPARLAQQLPQLSKPSFKHTAQSSPILTTTVRAFHQSTPKNSFFTSRTGSPKWQRSPDARFANTLVGRLAGASRSYYQQAAQPAADQGTLMRKLLVGGAIFGGTMVAINVVFNRETREDGGMPTFERSYLNNTFLHTGLGVGIIGLTAYKMIQTGFVYRLMVTNPWVFAIGGLALSFGTMIGTRSIDPDK